MGTTRGAGQGSVSVAASTPGAVRRPACRGVGGRLSAGPRLPVGDVHGPRPGVCPAWPWCFTMIVRRKTYFCVSGKFSGGFSSESPLSKTNLCSGMGVTRPHGRRAFAAPSPDGCSRVGAAAARRSPGSDAELWRQSPVTAPHSQCFHKQFLPRRGKKKRNFVAITKTAGVPGNSGTGRMSRGAPRDGHRPERRRRFRSQASRQGHGC